MYSLFIYDFEYGVKVAVIMVKGLDSEKSDIISDFYNYVNFCKTCLKKTKEIKKNADIHVAEAIERTIYVKENRNSNM